MCVPNVLCVYMYLCVVYVLGACRGGMRRPCVEDMCVCSRRCQVVWANVWAIPRQSCICVFLCLSRGARRPPLAVRMCACVFKLVEYVP